MRRLRLRCSAWLSAPILCAARRIFVRAGHERLTELSSQAGEGRALHRRRAQAYSITSSARSRNDSDTERPSVFAVFRLTTISNLVGCTTGRSVGLAPFNILPA